MDKAPTKSMSGQEFQRWRQRMGYTQRDAADTLKVTERTIRNWENGSTKVPKVVAIVCRDMLSKL